MIELTLAPYAPIYLAQSASNASARYGITNVSAGTGADVHVSSSGAPVAANSLKVTAPGTSNVVRAGGPLYLWSPGAARVRVEVAVEEKLQSAGSLVANPQALAGFAKALRNVDTALVGAGAVGDSLTAGAVCSVPGVTGMMDHLRRYLQARYGGGGRGFVPCVLNSGTAWSNPVTGVQSNQVGAQAGTIGNVGLRRSDGVGMQIVRLDAGQNGSVAWTLDGTLPDAEYRRNLFTRVYMAYAKNSTATAAPWTIEDVTSGSPVKLAEGTINASAGAAAGAAFLADVPVNLGRKYLVTVKCSPVGNLWLGGPVLLGGTSGIVLNNRATWGARLIDPGSLDQGLVSLTDATQRGVNFQANVGLFAAAPFNERLTIVGFCATNDDTSGTVTAQNFLDGANYLNDAILAAGSCPLWVCHSASTGRDSTFYALQDQIFATNAYKNGAAATVDLARLFGRPGYATMNALGFGVPDTVHRNDAYQEMAAARLFDGITDAVSFCYSAGLA